VNKKNLFTRFQGGTIAFIGFILSPLSWWNDLVVNFPISYIIALPFGLINQRLFLPAFVSAYWLTNILGLLMMQKGSKKALKPEDQVVDFEKELKSTLIWGSLYTVLIISLIFSGILSFPTEFLEKVK
jgi:hypothetical protein